MTGQEFRDYLVDLAARRARRNERAAAGLLELSRHIAGLPADDPRLDELRIVLGVDRIGAVLLGPGADRVLWRFRVDIPVETCDALLARLVEAARSDGRDQPMEDVAEGLIEP